MKVELQCGDKVAIPAGCKATVGTDYVLFEAEKPQFKRGDFLEKNGNVVIFSKFSTGDIFKVSAFLTEAKGFFCDEEIEFDNYHGWVYATTEEQQQLLEAMHAEGKDWDFKKQEVVDWEWRPKIGESYFVIDPYDKKVIKTEYDGDSIDGLNFKIGVAFRTRELAEAALEMLKQCKHY